MGVAVVAGGACYINNCGEVIPVAMTAGGKAWDSAMDLISTKSDAQSTNYKCMSANEPTIRAVLKGDTHVTLQKSVSLPVIQAFVTRVENGDRVIPPIKTDGNIIVDGNHRYIVGKLCKINVPITPSNAPNGLLRYPMSQIQLSPFDWGNR